MKRFHVHLHVDDLARSIAFYSKLFDLAPTRSAKHWITDPRGVAWEHFHRLENIPARAAAGCC